MASRVEILTRRWKRVDDANAYADLPTEWPHDEESCAACYDLAYVTAPMLKRGRNGSSYTDWDTHGLESADVAAAYPLRYAALLAHRRAVHRARRSAS